MAPTGPKALSADINVTPMIDVLLVLLVIFMLSIQFRYVFQVNVPPPAERKVHTKPSAHVVLDLPADGSYAINGTTIGFSELATRLAALTEGGQRQIIYVRAAPKRKYGDVIRAVDIAKGAGWQLVGYMP